MNQASTQSPRIRQESSIFWIDVSKIRPNSVQPRRVFNEDRLKGLSESIRQYGVLQPLVVIRHEKEIPTGQIAEYELIAGERRWRASQMAGLTEVPVVVREEPTEQIKLELALIENLQREDLNPLERAEAFSQLVNDFKMRHHEVGSKIGKSRVFVSNTIRLLGLPDEIKEGLQHGLITEGHTRPLLSLVKNKDDQMALYKEVVYRKMSVRETEKVSRDLVKKAKEFRIKKMRGEGGSRQVQHLQKKLSDLSGARVMFKENNHSRKVSFEFFSEDELAKFLSKLGVESKAVSFEKTAPSEEERVGAESEVISSTLLEINKEEENLTPSIPDEQNGVDEETETCVPVNVRLPKELVVENKKEEDEFERMWNEGLEGDTIEEEKSSTKESSGGDLGVLIAREETFVNEEDDEEDDVEAWIGDFSI